MARKRGKYKTPLTDREKDILCLLSLPDVDIANRLYISTRSVRQSNNTIFKKLKVKSRTEAVIKALRQGIVDIWDMTISTDGF